MVEERTVSGPKSWRFTESNLILCAEWFTMARSGLGHCVSLLIQITRDEGSFIITWYNSRLISWAADSKRRNRWIVSTCEVQPDVGSVVSSCQCPYRCFMFLFNISKCWDSALK